MTRTGLQLDGAVARGTFRLSLSLTVKPGEVLAVLGPNGSGKSTLLRALSGLTPLAAGRLTLDGQVLDDVTTGTYVEPSRRPVGFVFQDYRLFPYLSATDNVAFGPRARGVARPAAIDAARTWLERLGLGAVAERRPGQLSGGQAQRVALARALASDPGLLLLDEPLAALDARTRLDVQAELRGHLADFAGPSIIVTHDPLDALVLADRLVVVEGGEVVQDGAPAVVARRPGTDYVARLVGLNLWRGRVDGPHVRLDGGGELTVLDHDEHGEVLVAVRPSAIVVGSSRPADSSVRNAWAARVDGLTMLADRVRLDVTGSPGAIVDVTPDAVAELRLAPGSEVWLSVKATDLEVYASPSTAA